MQGSPDKKLPRCVTTCQVSCKILARSYKAVQSRLCYKIRAKFLARFWQDHARQSRQEIAKMCYKFLAKFLARFWQDHARQSRQEIAKMCYKILAKFLARFWQEHARQSRQKIAKTCYKILKILARSCKAVKTRNCQDLLQVSCKIWQDHARQSRQEIANMCYKILAKFLATLRQESCMILERFGPCNDIHNSGS